MTFEQPRVPLSAVSESRFLRSPLKFRFLRVFPIVCVFRFLRVTGDSFRFLREQFLIFVGFRFLREPSDVFPFFGP